MNLVQNEIIPITFDRMFTEIFNNEDNICILEEFISDYFGYELESVRGNLKIESRNLQKRKYDSTKKEVDLLLNYDDKEINIEMSTGWNKDVINRNVLFLCDIHSNQNYRRYTDIKPTVQINLLGFNFRNKFKSSIYLCDPSDGYIVTEKLRMDIINMEKGSKMCYTDDENTNKLIKWSKVFMSKTKEELESVLKDTISVESQDKLIYDVVRLSGDEEMKKNYEEMTKHELEYDAMMSEANERLDEANEKLDKANERLDKANERLDEANERLDEVNKEKEKVENERVVLEKEKMKLEKDKKELIEKLLKNNVDINIIESITGVSLE